MKAKLEDYSEYLADLFDRSIDYDKYLKLALKNDDGDYLVDLTMTTDQDYTLPAFDPENTGYYLLVSDGTATSEAVYKLIDSYATFQTDGVATGDVVVNTTDGTQTTVAIVDSEIQITLADDIFETAEEYLVLTEAPIAVS